MQAEPKTKTPLRDTTLGILVSLYLILLGFFAVLNAVSQDRLDKTGAALESVNTSFKAREAAGPEVVDLLSGRGPAAGIEGIVRHIGRIFENAVTFMGSFPRGGETSLRLILPRDEVISEQGVMTEKAQTQFEAFGDALMAIGSRGQIEITLTVGTGATGMLSEPSGPTIRATGDAMILARALEGLEAFRGRLGVGYAGIPDEHIQLRLRLSGPAGAPFDFSDAGSER